MENNLKKDIMALRIKTRRLALGYTMQELAEKVGVQKSAVCKWEKGSVSNIPTSRLKRLATALDCDPVWLIGIPEVEDDMHKKVGYACISNIHGERILAAYINASEKDKKAVRTILDLPDDIDLPHLTPYLHNSQTNM